MIRDWLRAVYICAGAALLLPLGLLYMAVTTDETAGASVVNGAPWAGTPTSPAAENVWGECNEAFVTAWPSGGNVTQGFFMQVACQGEMPAGASLEAVDATIPSSGSCSYPSSGGGSWACGAATHNLWQQIGPGAWTAVAGHAVCAASTAGVSPEVFNDLQSTSGGNDHDICAASSSFYPVSSPTGTPHCSSGSVCYYSATQVQNFTVTAASTASNGQSMQGFTLLEDVRSAGREMTCNPTCGGTLSSGAVWPDAPFYGVGQPCNGQKNYINPANDNTFNGSGIGTNPNNVGSADLLGAEFVSLPSGTSSWYNNGVNAGTTGLGIDMKLDSLTCATGPLTGTQLVQPPANFYTGGSASPFPEFCGLVSVGGWPSSGAGSNPTFTAGTSYSLTFSFVGGVSEIAVDPGDQTGTVQFGPNSTYQLGADSAVSVNPSSPETLTFTPATTGQLDPQFWCLGTDGNYYNWGFGQGLTNSGSGSSTTEGNVTCIKGTDGQLVCLPPSTSQGLAQCFASAGWSLTNPVSWVTGALHDGLCILEWLFVPASSTLGTFVNLFTVSSSGTSSATVGQWLGSLTTFVSDFPSTAVGQIQTAAAGGCSYGPTVSAGGASFTLCSAVSGAGSSTSWTFVDSVVTALFCVMAVLALFHMVRRAITGSTA